MNVVAKISPSSKLLETPLSIPIGDDPIFAAIENHRSSWAANVAAVRACDEVRTKKKLSKDWWCWSVSNRKPPAGAHPANVEAEMNLMRAADASDAAAFALLDTRPRTIRGVTALLRYSAEFEAKEGLWPSSVVIAGKVQQDSNRWHVALERHVAISLDQCSPVVSTATAAEADFGDLESDVYDLANMAFLASSALEEAIATNPKEITGSEDKYLIRENECAALLFSVYHLQKMIGEFKQRYFSLLEHSMNNRRAREA